MSQDPDYTEKAHDLLAHPPIAEALRQYDDELQDGEDLVLQIGPETYSRMAGGGLPEDIETVDLYVDEDLPTVQDAVSETADSGFEKMDPETTGHQRAHEDIAVTMYFDRTYSEREELDTGHVSFTIYLPAEQAFMEEAYEELEQLLDG